MIFEISMLLLVAAVNSQRAADPYRYYRPTIYETPKPYSFRYNALHDDGIGQISRTETADASGRVQGSYSLVNDEGHSRTVHYVADEDGFRAHVRTNEPGTDNENPADVVMESYSPFAKIQFGSNPYYHRVGPTSRRLAPSAAREAAAPEAAPVEPAAPEVVPGVPRPIDGAPTFYRPPYRRPRY